MRREWGAKPEAGQGTPGLQGGVRKAIRHAYSVFCPHEMLRVFKGMSSRGPSRPPLPSQKKNKRHYLNDFALFPYAVDLLDHVDDDNDRPAVLQEAEDDLVLVQLEDVGVEFDAFLFAGADF